MCVFLTCRNELWGVDFPGTVAKPGYMLLYNASARAVKAVDPSLKVGGPATAGLADLPAFVTACAAMGLPRPDFVSSHHCTCLPSPVACINAASVCSSRPGGCICSLFNSLRLLHIIGTGSLRLDIMNVCVCVRARALRFVCIQILPTANLVRLQCNKPAHRNRIGTPPAGTPKSRRQQQRLLRCRFF